MAVVAGQELLFRKGFLKYLQNGKFSDITLECDNKEYKAHRAVLAYSSEYFARLLLSEFREATQSHVSLKFPDPQNVFSMVLDFMYSGRISLTLDNVIPLLTMADHYLIRSLEQLCTNFLTQHIQRDSAIVIIKSALSYPFEHIITNCLNVIAKNFCNIRADYNFFPPELFLQLLSHEDLVVKDEFELYEMVCDYIKNHAELEPEQIHEMMGTIRYIWMTYLQINTVEENQLVPREFIIEAVMERLGRFEVGPGTSTNSNNNNNHNNHTTHPLSPSTSHSSSSGSSLQLNNHSNTNSPSLQHTNSNSSLNPPHLYHKLYYAKEDNVRLHPRPPQSFLCECPSSVVPDGDVLPRGILYHIATKGEQESWQNPAVSGRITVMASSVERGATADLVNLLPSDLWTKDIPSSWFTIDIGPNRSVIPAAYGLRHGMSFRADSLRTWDLQGSTNGENWVLLRRHANDGVLNGRYASYIWKTFPHLPTVNTHMPFRYFRILQTGRNSNSRNFLVLSGFELYGELFERI